MRINRFPVVGILGHDLGGAACQGVHEAGVLPYTGNVDPGVQFGRQAAPWM